MGRPRQAFSRGKPIIHRIISKRNAMTNYRRNRVPGGTFFFTVAIADRHLDILVRHIDLLKTALYEARKRAPFVNLGLVVLPDHLHAVWRLPEGDADYSSRWRSIKGRFSRVVPPCEWVSDSRAAKRERGVWQRRFWEHTIRDEEDLHRHLDYVHYNPVKHGLVTCAADWPHSTFHHYVRRGVYPPDWGGGTIQDGDYGE